MSVGSKATLRNQLRAYLGLADGVVIIVLRCFGCMLDARNSLSIEHSRLHDEFADWGKGQFASKATTNKEIELEREVTSYIKNLPILYISNVSSKD